MNEIAIDLVNDLFSIAKVSENKKRLLENKAVDIVNEFLDNIKEKEVSTISKLLDEYIETLKSILLYKLSNDVRGDIENRIKILQSMRGNYLSSADYKSAKLQQAKEKRWNKKYNELINFFNEHKRWPIQKEANLGTWCINVRALYKSGKLSPEWVRKLEKISFEFNVSLDKWNDTFNELKKYIKKYDDLPKSGHELYAWYRYQLRSFESLNDEKQKKILSIKKIQYPDTWYKKYEEVKLYIAENKKLTDSLRNWIIYQRKKEQINKLEKEKVALLNKLNINLNVKEYNFKKQWNENYKNLIYFKKKNNRLPSPSSEDSEEKSLYIWCQTQRLRYKLKKMSEDQIIKLNNIEFNWVASDIDLKKWDINFEKLSKYVSENGQYVSYLNNRELYNWIITQGRKIKEGKLPKDRENKFMSLNIKIKK